MLGFAPDSIYVYQLQHIFMFTLQRTRPGSYHWVRYSRESCLIWPSLYRHRPLGMLAAIRLTPKLRGWRLQPYGVSSLMAPTLLGVPSVACLAPMLWDWTRQGTRPTFDGSSSFRAPGSRRNKALSVLSAPRLAPILGAGVGNNSAYHRAEA
jgi:hypothetical protein